MGLAPSTTPSAGRGPPPAIAAAMGEVSHPMGSIYQISTRSAGAT